MATFWRMAPRSISPYVAKASVVAGVQTGSASSAASAKRPLCAANWKRAVPAISAAAGNRTSTRSLAGTVTWRPCASVMAALVARRATWTGIGRWVWFRMPTGIANRSPQFRERAGELGCGGASGRAAVVGRDGDLAAAPVGDGGGGGAEGDLDGRRALGLVLQADRPLEPVAEVEDAGRRGPHHERHARGDAGLAG